MFSPALVVDDDEMSLRIVFRILEVCKIETVCVSNTAAALENVGTYQEKNDPFQLMVID